MKHKTSISNDQAVIQQIRESPKFAVEYLKAAMEDTQEPQSLLIALRHLVEARGGFAKVAQAVGIQRESLHRALSARGNPRFSTLLAVVHAIGLKLTLEAA
jgi:probable addiction module antidote protein